MHRLQRGRRVAAVGIREEQQLSGPCRRWLKSTHQGQQMSLRREKEGGRSGALGGEPGAAWQVRPRRRRLRGALPHQGRQGSLTRLMPSTPGYASCRECCAVRKTPWHRRPSPGWERGPSAFLGPPRMARASLNSSFSAMARLTTTRSPTSTSTCHVTTRPPWLPLWASPGCIGSAAILSSLRLSSATTSSPSRIRTGRSATGSSSMRSRR
jgi:hypothetical protein